eukprot:1090369-Pyramimonas_sp.AAC.1
MVGDDWVDLTMAQDTTTTHLDGATTAMGKELTPGPTPPRCVDYWLMPSWTPAIHHTWTLPRDRESWDMEGDMMKFYIPLDPYCYA